MLLELAQLLARGAMPAGIVLGQVGLWFGPQAERPPDPLHVDPQHAGTLTAGKRADGQPGKVAQRSIGAVAQCDRDLLSQRV